MSRRTKANRHGRGQLRAAMAASTVAVLFAVAGLCAAPGTAAPDSTALSSEATSAQGGGGSPAGGSRSHRGSRSKSLKLKSEHATPNKVFFFGKRKATYHYSIAGSERRNLKIQAVNRRNWRVARTWTRRQVRPGRVNTIRWAGTGKHGRPASAGRYVFRVRTRHGDNASRSRVDGDDRSFGLFPSKFPIRGRHTYGDGYGAARSGHSHQGQDVFARCGKKLVAARGGRIQYRGYQASGAGYYLVVDGKGTSRDYVYMHLKRRGRPKRGQRVRTGQRIGSVGQTGNASGCHLHFEMWTGPGWYEGGRAMRSVTRHLRDWDHWS